MMTRLMAAGAILLATFATASAQPIHDPRDVGRFDENGELIIPHHNNPGVVSNKPSDPWYVPPPAHPGPRPDGDHDWMVYRSMGFIDYVRVYDGKRITCNAGQMEGRAIRGQDPFADCRVIYKGNDR